MGQIYFDLTVTDERQATAAQRSLVLTLLRQHSGLPAPPSWSFGDVSAWLDDVLASETPPPLVGYFSEYAGDPVGSMVDTTQFEIPDLGC